MNKVLIDMLIKQAEEGHKAGDYKKEHSAYQKLFILFKCEFGKKNKHTINILEHLAYSYVSLGFYNKGLELQKEVYVERKTILGMNHRNTLIALVNLANYYDNLGDYNKALEINNAVYNAFKETQGENHPDTLVALHNLVGSYYNLGDYSKALEIANAVYERSKNALGDNHPDTLSALGNLAVSYSKLGDYNKALEIANIVYETSKNALGDNHPDTLSALGNLAIAYTDLGGYNSALEMRNTVYNATKELLGENHPDTIHALGNLANSYSDLGDYNKALELRNEVCKATKELLGKNHPDTLAALHNLAGSYNNLGDYNKALEIENAVYNARKEIQEENHPDTLTTLGNLAVSYSDLGDYNKALEIENAVYNARKEIQGENHPDTLTTLGNLANAYTSLGDYNKALEIENAVYNAKKGLLGETHPDTLTSLNNLAISYSYLGDYNKAFELLNTVYNARKEHLGEKHPDTLSTLGYLASTYSNLGDYNKAFELLNTVYNARKEILGENHPRTLTILSALMLTQIMKNEKDSQSIKKYMTAYFENINKLKATAFSIKEISSRRNFLESFTDIYKLLKLFVFEKNIHDLLNYLFINKNLSFEIDVNRFHDETMSERLSLEEVIHSINNQLIIDFYILDDSRYGLILIKNGKYSQCMADYSDIINGAFINDEDIQSFFGSLEDYDHIYICPDDDLYNISFERILNCHKLSYLSSVQALFKKNTDDSNTNQLVSFVYPDFSGRLPDDNDRGDTKGVLYGSYLEGMFIHDIYGENSIVYSSYQANHNNFLETKRPRILHVSTHGDYLDNEHMEPMDRGILCLSGYNVEENNSGYISAREIQYMDLKGTELAVLSACNTGLGENISGEGIYGIRRAFELAGCQTLLLTVEEVDDFNSAIFMKSFYERYNETNNIYQSFKDTKEYLKEHGLKELRELKDVFEEVMKNKINSRIVYTRNLKELNRRIEESETREQIVRKKNGEYVIEDWNGFIIQGKIEN